MFEKIIATITNGLNNIIEFNNKWIGKLSEKITEKFEVDEVRFENIVMITLLIIFSVIAAITIGNHIEDRDKIGTSPNMDVTEPVSNVMSLEYYESISQIKSLTHEVSALNLANTELKTQISDMMVEIEQLKAELEEYRNNAWIRDIPLDEKYQKYLYEVCLEMNIDYDLQLAKIQVESNFNVNAINTSNSNGSTDYGLSQINSTHLQSTKDMGLDIVNNVYDNLYYGCLVYSEIKDNVASRGYTGREMQLRSLNAYNFGEAGFRKYMEKGNDYDDWYYGNKVINTMKGE